MKQGTMSSKHAILWAILSCFFAAVMISIVKYLSTDIHATVMVFWRNVVGLVIFLPWIFSHKSRVSFKTSAKHLYILRGCIGLAAMLFWYYALKTVSLSNAVALNFTAPLFATIAAILILKERMGFHRWIMLFIGFSGALIILRPDTEVLHIASLLVLLSALLLGLNAVITKLLTRTESSKNIVFYMGVIMTPLSLPFALAFWQWPEPHHWAWLIALGLASTASQWTASIAMSKADITVIIPYDFSRLIFASVIAYFAFAEIIELHTIIGAIVILASAFYITKREAVINKAASGKLDEI